MNPATNTSASPVRPRLRDFLELVKFSHTIFALPFALSAMIVAARGLPSPRTIGWILVAMVGARTAAMGWNRIVDRDVDARNPRTQSREIPAGKVSVSQAAALVAVASVLFMFAAFQLSALAGWLSIPTLALLFFYSWCKRFTSLSHFVLGLCLGIAPAGAYVAVRGYTSVFQIEAAPIALCVAVMLWVAGFDVIYATMDADFDREAGLHSLVQKLGIGRRTGILTFAARPLCSAAVGLRRAGEFGRGLRDWRGRDRRVFDLRALAGFRARLEARQRGVLHR
jgi:4-hydroxybenzoate polyprenyltransferase